MGCYPSHWLYHIFQRGRSTTNQKKLAFHSYMKSQGDLVPSSVTIIQVARDSGAFTQAAEARYGAVEAAEINEVPLQEPIWLWYPES